MCETAIRNHRRLFAVWVFGVVTMASGTMASAQVRPSTSSPTSSYYRHPSQVQLHRNPVEAVGDAPDVVTHNQVVTQYWRQLDRFNVGVDAERSRLRLESERRNAVVCKDFRAVVLTDEPGGTPTRFQLETASPPYQTISRATGRGVDGISPEGKMLENMWRYNTKIGYRTFCEIPLSRAFALANGLRVTPVASPVPLTSFGPQISAGPSSLTFGSPPTDSWLFREPTGPYNSSRYSLGIDYSAIGRQSQEWSRAMEAKYPWLAKP